ncbi:MAG: hypothetical protein ACSHXY_00735 [Alphaproteobacteria bacterium]
MTHFKYLILAGLITPLAACATAPEPEPIPEPVTIIAQPVNTCVPLSALRRVVIPAVTKTVIAITEIENPPYEPIQRKEEQTREVSPEQVYYVDGSGRQVSDICDPVVTPETMTR